MKNISLALLLLFSMPLLSGYAEKTVIHRYETSDVKKTLVSMKDFLRYHKNSFEQRQYFKLKKSLDTLIEPLSTSDERFLDIGSETQEKLISGLTSIDTQLKRHTGVSDPTYTGHMSRLIWSELVIIEDKSENRKKTQAHDLSEIEDLEVSNVSLLPGSFGPLSSQKLKQGQTSGHVTPTLRSANINAEGSHVIDEKELLKWSRKDQTLIDKMESLTNEKQKIVGTSSAVEKSRLEVEGKILETERERATQELDYLAGNNGSVERKNTLVKDIQRIDAEIASNNDKISYLQSLIELSEKHEEEIKLKDGKIKSINKNLKKRSDDLKALCEFQRAMEEELKKITELRDSMLVTSHIAEGKPLPMAIEDARAVRMEANWNEAQLLMVRAEKLFDEAEALHGVGAKKDAERIAREAWELKSRAEAAMWLVQTASQGGSPDMRDPFGGFPQFPTMSFPGTICQDCGPGGMFGPGGPDFQSFNPQLSGGSQFGLDFNAPYTHNGAPYRLGGSFDQNQFGGGLSLQFSEPNRSLMRFQNNLMQQRPDMYFSPFGPGQPFDGRGIPPMPPQGIVRPDFNFAG
ncbi:MAG: hypothetical protein HYS98_00995 [Deltaproteobacteria bacterium]|nr:hypothetical protein [Deltaproteobacteria bacterium]